MANSFRYSKINKADIANGPGVRVSLFVQGCSRHCPGCFNPETWDYEGGKLFDDVAYYTILDEMEKDYISGLTVLGGEPLDAPWIKGILYAVKSLYPAKTTWLYTGYRYEELTDEQMELLQDVDILVDGMFLESERLIDGRFRGSGNQRFIDIKNSRQSRSVVEAKEYYTREGECE